MKRFKSKKQGDLSIGMIVAMVLALLTLAVLAYILSTRAKSFGSGVNPTCKEMGGECMKSCTNEKLPVRILAPGCTSDGGKAENDRKQTGPCCIPLGD